MRVIHQWVAVIWCALAVAVGGPCWADVVRVAPNHYYTPTTTGAILQWDANLNLVGSIPIPAEQTGGIVYNHQSGTLVYATMIGSTLRIREVDATGQVLREHNTLEGMNGFTNIDFDAVRGRYGFADRSRVTFLDASLNRIGTTASRHEAVSGVTFGPDGKWYITDSADNDIWVYDASTFSPTATIAMIPTRTFFPTSLDFDRTGQLLVVQNGYGTVEQLNVATGAMQMLVGPIGFGDIDNVIVGPDGRFVTTGNGDLRLYAHDGALLGGTSGQVLRSGFGIASAFVPVPSAAWAGMLLLAGIVAVRVARR